MTDELFPCDHCGGKWAFGFSHRLLKRPSAPARDYLTAEESIAPEINDLEARSLFAIPQGKVCCIFCEDCGMQTPWVAVGNDRHAALEQAGTIWNARTRRPAEKRAIF